MDILKLLESLIVALIPFALPKLLNMFNPQKKLQHYLTMAKELWDDDKALITHIQYAVLINNLRVDSQIIDYLKKFPQPLIAFDYYKSSDTSLLTYNSESDAKLLWANKKYNNSCHRLFKKSMYFFGGFICSLIAATVLYAVSTNQTPLWDGVIIVILFFLMAYLFFLIHFKFRQAEKLIQLQDELTIKPF
ncbi:hypothetical protein [Pelistega suis]|uniref:hypothetical protein n=1 Tax=Pelistega suis TaxID=1631957 RepID=UPI00211CD00B|nr:hypothetical protein [Pelistega suis]MCQ9328020.1 hypothetical protein [Pelistega suis]